MKTSVKQLIILLLIIPTKLFAQSEVNYQEILNDYTKSIEKSMKQNNVIGASIALVSRDSIIWVKGLGFENKENSTPTSANTQYGLGSVTKLITSTAVMQLVDKEQINLDIPFKNYLPQFNIKGDDIDAITPRNILTHHAGLPSDIFSGMFSHKPQDYTEVANMMNEEHITLKPNTIKAYSNPAFTLLGHMVSEVSNMPYQAYVQQHIFKPLGMKDSHFNGGCADITATYDKEGEKKDDTLVRDLPAGGAYTNVNDMAVFLQSYLNQNETLFSQKAYNEIFSVQNEDIVLDMGREIGITWNKKSDEYNGTVWYHTGATMYFNAMVAVAPETGLGIIVLTNSNKGGRLFKPSYKLLADFAKELGADKNTKEEAIELTKTKKVNVDSKLLKSYQGIYVQPGAAFTLAENKGKLTFNMGKMKAKLIPVADNSFIPVFKLFGFVPIKLKELRFKVEEMEGHTLLTQYNKDGSKEILGSKVEAKPIDVIWKNRIGTYQVANKREGEIDFITNFEMKESNGLMMIAFNVQGVSQKIEMALDMTTSLQAKVMGLGRYGGNVMEITKTENNEVIKIYGFELIKSNI